MHRYFSTMAGALALVLSASASAQERYLLLDAALRPELVNVVSIGPGGLLVSDPQGGTKTRALSDVVALAPSWWRAGTDESEHVWSVRPVPRRVALNTGMILLSDARRIVGRLASSAGGDRVTWEHPRLGAWTFSLEEVRRLQVQALPAGARTAPNSASNDRVVMTNADVVAGFVESIGDSVKVETDGRMTDLSLKQVAIIELANPLKAASGARLWLEDGSVLGAPAFAEPKGDAEVRIALPAAGEQPAPAIPFSQLAALVPDASRLIPLASLPIESQRGVGERLYAEPVVFRWRGEVLAPAWRDAASSADRLPPLDAPDIELPGPMIVEWSLPPGAMRVAGWAEIPSEARLWAECTLTFEGVTGSGGSVSLGTESLSGTRVVSEFNIELPTPPPARLRVRIDPGERGPIQDRVVLRRALVLVGPTAQ